jgi:uncharacterized protein
MNNVEIHKTANLKKLKKPIIIIGFPGTGLVGSVAAAHLIDSPDFKFGGYITSTEFAPLAAIHDYRPLPAARIHFSEKHNLVVIISEMTIPVSAASELADDIFDFANSLKAKSVVSLGGIVLKEGGNDVYVVSSDMPVVKEITGKKIAKPIKEGATTGVTGVLLAKGTLTKFPVTALLAEASEDYLDPKAASNVLKALSKMIGVKIDTSRLDKEAKEIRKRVGRSIMKSRIGRKKGGAAEGGSMYG